MLSDLKIHPTIPAADMERAKKFYKEKLELEPKSEHPGGLIYETGGVEFLLFPSKNAGSNPSTYAGWRTDDIEATIKELKDRGVVFEEYDTPSYKTVNSVATFGKTKSAWFKDSEGNTLGIVQMG